MMPRGSVVLSFRLPLLLRSVIVENASGQNSSCTSTSELLKPMKKRKHREYQSPSEEESEPDAMVGSGGRGRLEALLPTIPSINPGQGLGQKRHVMNDSLILFWGFVRSQALYLAGE